MAAKSPVLRHEIIPFYGVPSTSTGGHVFKRMKFFTEFEGSKNPEEHSRKYIDEPNKRTDVVGFAPEYAYAFDFYRDDEVHGDIVAITNNERIGELAVRPLVLVDTLTGDAWMRDYSVIPDSEGDDENIYTYSGTFKANGEQTKMTATSADNWQTISTSAPENGS